MKFKQISPSTDFFKIYSASVSVKNETDSALFDAIIYFLKNKVENRLCGITNERNIDAMNST